MLLAARRFPAELASIGAARSFVRSQLPRSTPARVVDDVVLLTSELVTNALLHATTSVELAVHAATGVRLEVRDGSPELPVVESPPPTAVSGRGMRIVDDLCTRWGVEPAEDGKCVWCEVATGA